MTNDENRWFGDSDLGERFPAWTRGNAADVFPDPFSPLGQSMVLRNGMSHGLRDAYISIGVMDYEEFEAPEAPDLFKMFGGYIYNPLTLTRVLGARMPGVTPELIDQAFFDDRDDVPPYEAQPWHDSAKHEARLGESMGWAMSAATLPELDADRELARAQREQRPDLATLTDAALIARARAKVPLLQQTFESAVRITSLASLGPGALGAVCEGIGKPELAGGLLAGIEVDSAAPSREMWALGRQAAERDAVRAAFDQGVEGLLARLAASDDVDAAAWLGAFESFLHAHGARAQNEYDLISRSWEVRPEIALSAIDLMRRSDESQSPAARNATSVAERDRSAAEIRELIADDAEAAGTFEAALQSSKVFLSGRERAKTNVVIVINEMRVALREYGRRLVERGVIDEVEQVFMVTDRELDQLRFEEASFSETIRDRWARSRVLFERRPGFIVNGRVPSLDEMTLRADEDADQVGSGTVLSGAAGSGGSATGRARVVLDAADPTALEPGDVLVAPQTDPSWVPLFVAASAVVVDVGALGSHAMIVSRELGIPCVASVEDATKRIPDGATVTVDGNTGTVTVH